MRLQLASLSVYFLVVYVICDSDGCSDIGAHCTYFSNAGYCTHSYVRYMNYYCKKTCNACTDVDIGGACVKDSNCESPNSACVNGKCACLAGFKIVNGTCHGVGIGDACVQDSNCKPSKTACVSGKCTCTAGFKGVNGTCHDLDIGDACVQDSNCEIRNSACVSGKCACQTGFKVVNGTCHGLCTEDATDYYDHGSDIANGVKYDLSQGDCKLACQENNQCKFYTYSIGGRTCYLKRSKGLTRKASGVVSGPQYCHYAALGGACKRDSRCETSNSGCVDGTCQCLEGYKGISGKCWEVPVYCIEPGQDWSGSQVGIEYNIASPPGCQTQCQGHSGCKFWSFAPSNGTCWLKDARGAVQSFNFDRVSGPKDCPSYGDATARAQVAISIHE